MSFPSSLRPVLAGLMLLSGLFLPWFVAGFFALLLCIRYRAWEVVGIAMFLDLYWMPTSVPTSLPYMTLFAVALVVLFEPLRRQLLAYMDFGI